MINPYWNHFQHIVWISFRFMLNSKSPSCVFVLLFFFRSNFSSLVSSLDTHSTGNLKLGSGEIFTLLMCVCAGESVCLDFYLIRGHQQQATERDDALRGRLKEKKLLMNFNFQCLLCSFVCCAGTRKKGKQFSKRFSFIRTFFSYHFTSQRDRSFVIWN